MIVYPFLLNLYLSTLFLLFLSLKSSHLLFLLIHLVTVAHHLHLNHLSVGHLGLEQPLVTCKISIVNRLTSLQILKNWFRYLPQTLVVPFLYIIIFLIIPFHVFYKLFPLAFPLILKPTSYSQVVKNLGWCKAMDAKLLLALEENDTWILTDLPHLKEAIGYKYVYKVKRNSYGSIERLKARLVAKRYTQQVGVDYHETFLPIAKMDIMRCLFSIVAVQGLHLHQFDVNNGFLHGDLEEDIYMHKPPGHTKGGPQQVCKLLKSLYGLK